MLTGVDAVITDPPYGDKTHQGARTGGSGKETLITFQSITEESFMDLCKKFVMCERCTSPMQYTTAEESCHFGVVDVDYWLCLFCGYEVITEEQTMINDARLLK